jgi:hypothetical protein
MSGTALWVLVSLVLRPAMQEQSNCVEYVGDRKIPVGRELEVTWKYKQPAVSAQYQTTDDDTVRQWLRHSRSLVLIRVYEEMRGSMTPDIASC